MAEGGALSEDSVYRTSTQYRKWSFSGETLAAARKATNDAASKRICRLLLQPDTNTLTVDEELLLVRFYSEKVMELANFQKVPAEVAATAVQFLRRFYILNSCMDYDPKHICTSALFLATKTDNFYMALRDFAKNCNMAPDDIIAPEFRLMQGLQFAFDVRHPRRGLEAAMMLFEDISQGKYQSPTGTEPAQLQRQFDAICASTGQNKVERLHKMHTAVRALLRGGAILTDAYFLYTPAQIWLGALQASDPELAHFYLGCILAGIPQATRELIEQTINACAELISSSTPIDDTERKRVTKKLRQCSNPETADLVKLNAAQKREAGEAGGNASKKQKLENGSKSDPFGPSIESR